MRCSLLKMCLPFALALTLVGCHFRGNQTSLDEKANAAVADLNGGGDVGDALGSTPKLHPASAEDSQNTAKLTADILKENHYLHDMDPQQITNRMFTLFIKELDPLHYYLLQSDIDEFAALKPDMYKNLLEKGDTSLASQIFARYQQRVDASVAQAQEELKNGKFTFTDNDSIQLDRKDAAPPKNLEEAKQLWHERLRYEYLQEKLSKSKPEDIVKTLTRRYTRVARAVHENDSDDIVERCLNALAHAYDPHSDYFGKAAMDRFNTEMKLSLVGIGASLETDDDGYAKIAELLPGGPAIRSNKFKVGDRIVAVAQGSSEPVDVIDMKLDKVVELIRGKKGTEVRLTVIPAGADLATRKTISLIRDEVKLEEQEAKAEVIDTPTADGKTLRLGYIDLPSFYADFGDESSTRKSTTVDMTRLVKKLEAEKVSGLILDLRNNGGGSLDEVIRLTGLFVKRGPVVQVKNSRDQIKVLDDDNSSVLYTGPMIVLTNRYSASASEILAGALQDYGRAVIVGDTSTFGKGSVQTIQPLDELMQRQGIKMDTDPGALKYTIQKFFRPSGSSTQLKGVLSDIVLPSVTDVISEYSEKTLDYPMPWDTISSSSFDKLSMVQPYLSELRKRSEARVKKDPDFAILQQVIGEEKRIQAQKTLSLNEAERLREKQDEDARLATLKKALAARPASKEKIYKFSVKQADMPGLPPLFDPKAVAKTTGATPDDATDPLAASAKSNGMDTTLEESERILMDLISLSPHNTASR